MDLHEVHGVDVSWLHHANKDSQHRRTPSSTSKTDKRSTDDPSTPSKPGIKQQPSDSTRAPGITPPTLSGAKKDETPVVSSMSSPLPSPTTTGRERSSSASKRPVIGSRTSSGAVPEDGAKSKRPGWINNLSSKFSSQSTPTRNAQPSTPLKSPPLTGGPQLGSSPVIAEVIEQSEPYVPSKPKESGSFFSSLSRRLSSGSQTGGNGRTTTAGVLAPRRVLNIDPNRERCLVPELDSSKLRKVSFCVDVEIAGGPKYNDDLETDADKQRKKAQAKLKERAEGEALKHPDAIKDDTTSQTDGNRSRSTSLTAPSSGGDEKDDDTAPRDSLDENASRKREKKKRSEAERKERKEQRLRRAQESGQIPVEFGGDDEEEDAAGTAPASKTPKQLRPTTDPARIYRRCCQLRETPILKRITEQLMNPKSSLPNEPGVVACLDLTGSRMQLPDVVTLGDWLAVVPVKRLLLEDADLNDEGVRCVLAGLLSAKKPELSRKKRTEPHHREGPAGSSQYRERSGIVEKVTFKNNPRISRNGWKHISLFIYMCRSIKAIDLSMNKFPDLPPSLPDKPAPSRDAEPAEIFFKCLSERLGGNRLEELSVSECQLKPTHLRKIIDGAMMCGVSRLGLAGNNLSDEGLEHVLHYLRSGVCHGIDLGGNNLKGKLELIADSLIVKPDNPCWGLSLSDCDLDADSVRPLFPALVKLPNFRFIDLGNNKKLCKSKDVRCHIITLLRRYLPQMKQLKRIHLNNVGMSPKQAIALAEILAECPRLAHVSILENPQISTLANGTDEETQEEACALYASLMVAVRCSKTLICLDVDVPSQDNSEVVKALAKQVVAYCLRNMEDFAIEELTGENAAANAAAQLAAPHGGEHGVKKMTYPDVLMHLVGHVDDVQENHDSDDPAPDDDYIVGGTGVVKALQYVLGEKANDLRRTSVPGSPASGPLHSRPGSSAGLDQLGKTKAHQMSRSLLDTARKIRKRLHPAIVKESTAGDEMAYRRLQFLDHTLQSMIARFEEEFPETKVEGTSTTAGVFLEVDRRDVDPPSFENEAPPELDLAAEEDEDDLEMHPGFHRRNSDASLYSRSMTLEEGRLHRLGQALRRDVIASSQSPIILPGEPEDKQDEKLTIEKERIRVLAEKIESTPGEVLKPLVDKHGWQAVLKQLGANYEDLRAMSEQDPEGWAQFTDAQLKAKLNLDRHRSVDESMPELSAV